MKDPMLIVLLCLVLLVLVAISFEYPVSSGILFLIVLWMIFDNNKNSKFDTKIKDIEY